jgi:HAD superfamily hydrolase (TIGR01484 family)
VYSAYCGELWQRKGIPRRLALEILELADRERVELSVGYPGINYWKKRDGQSAEPPSGVAFTASYTETLESELCEPVRIFTGDSRAVSVLRAYYEEKKSGALRCQRYYGSDGAIRSFGIFPSDAHKGTALEHICGRLDVPLRNTLAIGDSECDIPMIERAGIGIAMDNGVEALKAAADEVAPSNEDEGVAWALRRYIGPV